MESNQIEQRFLPPGLIAESLKRGREKGVKSEQTDALANLFVGARKKENLGIDELADKAGVPVEDLIDLECRQLFPFEAVIVAEKVMKVLDIDEDRYKKALLNRYPDI